jgi:TPR repeat protein
VPPSAPQDNPAEGVEAYRQAFAAFQSQHYTEAWTSYKACAASGNAECMYWLGRLYSDGLGVDRNYKEAEAWYEKSAAGGYATALYGVALLYLQGGPGLKKDCAEARQWLARAVKKGVGAQAECRE